MIYGLMADVVLGAHVVFVVFVVAGGILVLRWPRVAWIHVACALWGALVEVAGWICPLTPLEVSLRRRAGEAGYAEGFLEHYVTPVLYPASLTREVQIVLGVLVVVLNVAVYTWVWRRRAGRSPTRVAEGAHDTR
jgi:nitrate reductase gamma subunit